MEEIRDDYFVPVKDCGDLLNSNSPLYKIWDNPHSCCQFHVFLALVRNSKTLRVGCVFRGMTTHQTFEVCETSEACLLDDPESMAWQTIIRWNLKSPNETIVIEDNSTNGSMTITHSHYGILNVTGSRLSCPINQHMDTFILWA